MGLYQRGEDWYIDYYANGRRRREKVGPSIKLARDVLCKRKVQVAENKFLDVKKEQRIKFKNFADRYMETYAKPTKRSWASTDRHYLKKLTPVFGEKYLFEITPAMVEKYKAERSHKVSVAYVNRELACLKCMFNKAIDWGLAEENPVKRVKLFKENNTRTRFLEREEIERLLGCCGPKLRPIVVLLLNTGLRKAELQYLKWHDVDFERNFITLHNTKNGETRKVPLNQTAKATLISVPKHPKGSHIFCRKDGKPFNCRWAFERALKQANIKDFRLHDLRHTFASNLTMAGVDLNTIREILGHKSMTMVLRYAHLSPAHQAKAVSVLDRQMGTIWSPGEVDRTGPPNRKAITYLESVS